MFKINEISKINLAEILKTSDLYNNKSIAQIGLKTKDFIFIECKRLGLFKNTLQETLSFYSLT